VHVDVEYLQARLPDGSISRDPKFKDVNSTQYYGTVIPNPQTASTLPVLELYVRLACCAWHLCCMVDSIGSAPEVGWQ
jgi:hypothetical protein